MYRFPYDGTLERLPESSIIKGWCTGALTAPDPKPSTVTDKNGSSKKKRKEGVDTHGSSSGDVGINKQKKTNSGNRVRVLTIPPDDL